MTRDEFAALRTDFLATQDDVRDEEYYDTAEGIARMVFESLESFIFKAEIDRAKRYAAYLELKAEFDTKEVP